MRFTPTEPDIATVFGRINDKEIDLQPDFQRGEVWPISKKQRLIDTVLRGWVIPPVLLISSGLGQKQQVLDGQQRLASIRDFMLDEFGVDGDVAPADQRIKKLNGLRFSELPSDVSRAFLRTAVRMYEISDFNPEEPAEIFFRLNQPTGLTSAEKRNAFFGPVRDQIRLVTENFENKKKIHSKYLGFSNSRMAYDDVFARFAYSLEVRTLHTKVTSTVVNQMYRQKGPISSNSIDRLMEAVDISILVFEFISKYIEADSLRLNKATFYSWLLFFARLNDARKIIKSLANFFVLFEENRVSDDYFRDVKLGVLYQIYNDRASARVADVSSVLLRDFIIWKLWVVYSEDTPDFITPLGLKELDRLNSFDAVELYKFEPLMLDVINKTEWAKVI